MNNDIKDTKKWYKTCQGYVEYKLIDNIFRPVEIHHKIKTKATHLLIIWDVGIFMAICKDCKLRWIEQFRQKFDDKVFQIYQISSLDENLVAEIKQGNPEDFKKFFTK